MPDKPELTREQIVDVMASRGIGAEDISALTDGDFEVLAKSIAGAGTEDLEQILDDEDAQDALDGGDPEGFAKAVSKYMKCKKCKPKDADDAGDDEEDEEDNPDDVDDAGDDEEDEEDDWDDEDVDDAVSAQAKKQKVKKSLADAEGADPPADDDFEEVIAADEVVAEIAKSVTAQLAERDEGLKSEVKALRKSVAGLKGQLGEMATMLEQMGARPAGRKLPYSVPDSPLDGGDEETVETVSKSLLAAQQAGIIDGSEFTRIHSASKLGGPAWDIFESRYAEIKKSLADA